MPAVFVHGNPETSAIWDLLFAELERDDLVALSPPGFGAPVPAGFGATRLEYVDWLVAELEAIASDPAAGPIDLVGHDWGGGHVLGAMMARPDLVRSWASDIAGVLDPEYVWHDNAQVWQTPGAGEAAIEAMVAAPTDDVAARYEGLGMTPEIARTVAEAVNADMGRCVLSLYRSAVQPSISEAGAELHRAAAAPGLVIVASQDHYVGGEALARRSADKAGAQVTVLDGLGHWWMIQDPSAAAVALEAFWAS